MSVFASEMQGQDLEAEQEGDGPRVFKTHCWYATSGLRT
jgi:hypothetical protein